MRRVTNEEDEENEKEKLEKQVEELTLSLQMEKMARVNMAILICILSFIFVAPIKIYKSIKFA